MAFYLRKAFKTGPVRFNLSKGGIGISAGITGARIGLNRRGAYVHGGRHGVYYRKHLSSGGGRSGRAGLSEARGAKPGELSARTSQVYQAKSRQYSSGVSDVNQAESRPEYAEVYDVQHRAGQTDLFIDTGVTYPSAHRDLPERLLPKPPAKGQAGSTGLNITLGVLGLAGALLIHPVLLVVTLLPVALMIRARLLHQNHMDAAARVMDQLRLWIDGAGADKQGLEEAFRQFRNTAPPDYHPRFIQEWYIVAVEFCVLRTMEFVNRYDADAVGGGDSRGIDGLSATVDFAWLSGDAAKGSDWSLVERAVAAEITPLRVFAEELFELPTQRSVDIRLALYANELEAALEDHALTVQEERSLRLLARVLGLQDDDIQAEQDILSVYVSVRNAIALPLESVSSPVPLVRGEEAFGVYEPVRLLNERVHNRYQREKIVYRELGYESEMEGVLVLTDRRILASGRDAASGKSVVREYRLNRLADVFVDPARSILELVLTDRKSPVIFTTPDCVIVGAKIEQIRSVVDA